MQPAYFCTEKTAEHTFCGLCFTLYCNYNTGTDALWYNAEKIRIYSTTRNCADGTNNNRYIDIILLFYVLGNNKKLAEHIRAEYMHAERESRDSQ